eukprot:SAG31_NODE_6814_length_1880_cov_1.220663_1_plen_38_part_00
MTDTVVDYVLRYPGTAGLGVSGYYETAVVSGYPSTGY